MGADTVTEPFYPNNNCQGEWINDCPYYPCSCAKKALDDMHEVEEDYSKQSVNTAYGFLYWLVFLILLITAFIVASC
jgi:hypothetical protein